MDLVKYFISKSFKNYLERFIRPLIGRYDVKVRTFNKQGAFTDGKIINIGIDIGDDFKELTKAEYTLIYKGLLLHEGMHVLLSDFSILNNIYTDANMSSIEKDILKSLTDIVEDSAIERYAIKRYQGNGKYSILFMNEFFVNRGEPLDSPTIKSDLSRLMTACSQYGCVGKLKGELNEELSEVFLEMIPVIERGRRGEYPADRFDAAKELFGLIKKYIPQGSSEFEDDTRHDSSRNGENNSPESASCAGNDISEAIRNITAEKLRSKEVAEKESEETKAESNFQSTAEPNEQETTGDEQQGSCSNVVSKGDDGADTGEEDAETSSGAKSGSSENDEAKSEVETSTKTENEEAPQEQSVDNEESSNSESNKTPSADTSKSDNTNSTIGTENGEEAETGSENTAKETKTAEEVEEEILNEIQDAVDNEKEEEKSLERLYNQEQKETAECEMELNEIKALSKNIKFSSLHDGVDLHVKTAFYKGKEKYDEYIAENKNLIIQIRKQVQAVLRRREPEENAGYSTGKFCTKRLYRRDGKNFSRKFEDAPTRDITVALLIDESGSMDTLMSKVRSMAIALTEALQGLCSLYVIGHHAFPYVTIDVFVTPKDKESRYTLVNLSDYDNTREGMSLKWMYALLKNKPNPLLFVISDGQPYDSTPGHVLEGATALADAYSVVRENKNINTVGISLREDCKEYLQMMYPRVLDGTNIEKIPRMIANEVTRTLK